MTGVRIVVEAVWSGEEDSHLEWVAWRMWDAATACCFSTLAAPHTASGQIARPAAQRASARLLPCQSAC
eukprot:1601439-Pleurochrysis_carterae.AAC.2